MVDETGATIMLESVHRHGVTEHDMLHGVRLAIHHINQADNLVRSIGPDAAGTLIEVGVVTWWGGELAIAHAMRPARSTYVR